MKYAWKRFWCPRDAHFSLDDGGFLVDPDTDWGNVRNAAVKSLNEILKHPCLVLLGEPGMGKSITLGEAAEAARAEFEVVRDQIITVRLGEYASDERLVREVFCGEDITRWRVGHHRLHLFIDGLDEGLLQIRVLALLLVGQIEKLPIDRLYLRITCRTAVWPHFLEQELQRIWGNKSDVGVYELLPLRRSDVAAAVCGAGLSDTELVHSFQEAGIVALAIKPITLRFLIEAAKKQNGALPHSRTEAYDEGCLALCEEHNVARRAAGRRGTLDTESRRVIAARIAYVTLLTGRAAVWTGPRDPAMLDEDVLLGDFVGEEFVRGAPIRVDEEKLRESLDTGFFSSRGPNRMGWAHQTYAEYLAAWYIVHRRLSVAQMVSLFVHPDDVGGKLVPQLHECAAWLASMIPEFFELVLEREPEILLASDAVRFSDEQRSKMANAFVAQVVNGKARELDWPRYPKYRALKHPGLPDQLRPHIMNRDINRFARATLISIANSCALDELLDSFCNIALDTSEPISLRCSAAFGIAEYGNEYAKGRLFPLIKDQRADDPDDELKGIAMTALWPEHKDAEEFFAELTLPRRRNFYGAYYAFLSEHLTEFLGPLDMPAALKWVLHHMDDVRDLPYVEDVMRKIVRMALDHTDSPVISEHILALLLARAQSHFDLFAIDRDKESLNPFLVNREQSRKLFADTVKASSKGERHAWQYAVYHDPHMVDEEDISWVVQQLGAATDPNERSTWVEILQALVVQSKTLPDDALRECQSSQEIMEALRRHLGPIALNSPLADELRTRYRRWRQAEEKRARRPKPDPIDVQIRDILVATAKDIRWWAEIPHKLGQHSSSNLRILPTQSDDEPPAWHHLDDQLKREILGQAMRFLEEVNPQHVELTKPDTFSGVDWAAIDAYLLLMEHDTAQFQKITEDTWKKWSPTIVRLPLPSTAKRYLLGLELVREAYRKSPELVRTEVGCEFERKKNNDDWYRLDRFDLCWDDGLSRVLTPCLTTPGVSVGVFRRLANELVKRGDEQAMETLSGRFNDANEPGERRAIAAAALLSHVPSASWLWIKLPMMSDEVFGERVLQEYLIHNRHSVSVQFADAIPPDEIAELFVWLSRKYPHELDPKREGVSAVEFRDEVARWRDSLVTTLVRNGSRESCDALWEIANQLPHLDWLNASVLDCEANFRTKSWRAPDPKSILQLAEDASFRHVQSEEHLFNVVLESLGRLQQELLGELPTTRFLWDLQANSSTYRPVDENTFSDFIAKHLVRDLKERPIVVNREVQIRRGERTDIHVDALILNPNGLVHDKVTVIIETKCSWSQDLSTGLEEQLVGKYLKENRCGHGIYLVGWFTSTEWDLADYRAQAANRRGKDELLRNWQLRSDGQLNEGYTVRAFILNCEL